MVTTDALRSIDIRRWYRNGYLAVPCWFRWSWQRDGEVAYSIAVTTFRDGVSIRLGAQSGVECSPSIALERTPCHFGGERVWFSCPSWNCGRRAAILYLSPGGRVACRRCFRLAYECQREKPHDRAARRAVKIRKRLGDPDGYSLDAITRPKGMHWRTYQRLLDAHDAADNDSLRYAAAWFGRRSAGPMKQHQGG